MSRAWFLTGTDTEIGKTFTTCALLHAARHRGLTALGMKPVAAGVEADGRNEDVERILAASQPVPAREAMNPYLLQAPIAPHIAAREEGTVIELDKIRAAYEALAEQAEVVIVEGAGGFRIPLGDTVDSADLAVALGLPVILVVGLRLGCINHALLTAEAILARGLPLAGWVANAVDPAMLRREENIEALRQRLPAPLLGSVPHTPEGPAAAARFLRLPD